jgi:hypothetical protein
MIGLNPLLAFINQIRQETSVPIFLERFVLPLLWGRRGQDFFKAVCDCGAWGELKWLLREQRRPATGPYAHRQILALNVAGGDVRVNRIAGDDGLTGAHALRGAVARFRTLMQPRFKVINID